MEDWLTLYSILELCFTKIVRLSFLRVFLKFGNSFWRFQCSVLRLGGSAECIPEVHGSKQKSKI